MVKGESRTSNRLLLPFSLKRGGYVFLWFGTLFSRFGSERAGREEKKGREGRGRTLTDLSLQCVFEDGRRLRFISFSMGCKHFSPLWVAGGAEKQGETNEKSNRPVPPNRYLENPA